MHPTLHAALRRLDLAAPGDHDPRDLTLAISAVYACALSEQRMMHERDAATDAADRLAYALFGPDDIGEHTNLNCPWTNASELLERAAVRLHQPPAEDEDAAAPDAALWAARLYAVEAAAQTRIQALQADLDDERAMSAMRQDALEQERAASAARVDHAAAFVLPEML